MTTEETPKGVRKVEVQASKPGVKTTEFWKSLVVNVIAMIMIAAGQYKGSDALSGIGAILLAAVQGSYNLSRGMAKKTAPFVGVLLCSILFMGCCGSGVVRADAIEPTLHRVIDKYNVYVSNDETLSPLEERADLRDGELLLKVVREAQVKATEE